MHSHVYVKFTLPNNLPDYQFDDQVSECPYSVLHPYVSHTEITAVNNPFVVVKLYFELDLDEEIVNIVLEDLEYDFHDLETKETALVEHSFTYITV